MEKIIYVSSDDLAGIKAINELANNSGVTSRFVSKVAVSVNENKANTLNAFMCVRKIY